MDVKNNSNKIDVINELTTSNLQQTTKNKLIGQMIEPDAGRGDGMFDKIFGKKHPELYIALTIGVLIFITGGVCTIIFRDDIATVKELWKLFFPGITAVLGFVLGNRKG
nr:MAG TPA: hypothetical protein [Caudoviricetes sp.]